MISKKAVKHLKIARQLLMSKIESWTGREPFPGDPLKVYLRMINDVDLELHDVQIVSGDVDLTPRLHAVLAEYKTLLDDTVFFYNVHGDVASAEKYETALESVTEMLDDAGPVPKATEVEPPITMRPDSRCNEKGLCKIKVSLEVPRKDAPVLIGGQWMMQEPDTYSQLRDCGTCGRQWETNVRRGVAGTMQIKPSTKVML